MESLDAKTLIHAGVDFLAIASVTVWFSRKNSKLQEQIDVLNEHITKLEEIINSQNQIINQHHQILMGGMMQQPTISSSYPQRTKKTPSKITEEDLDKELEKELEEETDDECDEDVCPIKPKKKQKGKKKVRFSTKTT